MNIFFYYDGTLGEKAQRSLNDLLRSNAKDLETIPSPRGPGVKPKSTDLGKKPCLDYDVKDGCNRQGCNWLHTCEGCGEKGHGVLKYLKGKST